MQINVLTLSVITVKKYERSNMKLCKTIETFQGLDEAANDKKLRRKMY